MDISNILSPQAVFQRVKASTKKKLITEIAGFAAATSGLDADKVFEALWQREKLASTGVGHGVAIPHGRMAKLDKIVGLFVHLDAAIDFEAVDSAPVDLVFALLTPVEAGADHLKALAQISRLMRNNAVCEKLRVASDRSQIYALLTEPTVGVPAA
jgi:nitrogen PTS system EIIA component